MVIKVTGVPERSKDISERVCSTDRGEVAIGMGDIAAWEMSDLGALAALHAAFRWGQGSPGSDRCRAARRRASNAAAARIRCRRRPTA